MILPVVKLPHWMISRRKHKLCSVNLASDVSAMFYCAVQTLRGSSFAPTKKKTVSGISAGGSAAWDGCE